jgi:hypothetical protein
VTLPTWVTVLVCNVIAGFIAQRVDALLVLPFLLGNVQADTLAQNVGTWLLVDAAVNAVITGVLLLLLLPALSSLRSGFGTAIMATLAGRAVVFIGTILLLRATVQTQLAGGAGVGLLPAFGLFSLLLTIAGIWLTASIINNSAIGSGGGGGGGRLELYGGQEYLDEYRRGDEA